MKQISVLLSTILLAESVAETYVNVNGKPLQSCSSRGMALTGYTRSGSCTDLDDDAGSHHICIDLSSKSLAGGNFCDVTGQPDWCSSSMSCDGQRSKSCPVQNWCVCQWAFAKYLNRAGGCDKIQNIVCDATNMQAYSAYKTQAQSDASIKTALQCLETRCGLGDEAATEAEVPSETANAATEAEVARVRSSADEVSSDERASSPRSDPPSNPAEERPAPASGGITTAVAVSAAVGTTVLAVAVFVNRRRAVARGAARARKEESFSKLPEGKASAEIQVLAQA